MRRFIVLGLAAAFATFALACGSGGDDGEASSDNTPSPSETQGHEDVTLRLGYFANVTHAQPQVGLARGTFAEALGANVTIEPKTFNAGPDVITALFAGEIDASYIGPNPAINGYVRSEGKELRIIAGATSGGARLIVRPDAGIDSPDDFSGKRVATPQLGNTQDVALRSWLADNGLNAREQGGDVQVLPAPGLALGIDGGQAYEEERVAVEPGASVVLFTDGVLETRHEGELYGEARLDAFLREHAELGAQALVDALVADVRAFGGGDLDDDCAVVCLRLAR